MSFLRNFMCNYFLSRLRKGEEGKHRADIWKSLAGIIASCPNSRPAGLGPLDRHIADRRYSKFTGNLHNPLSCNQSNETGWEMKRKQYVVHDFYPKLI